MNKYAIVENGKVVNAALSEKPLADNWIETDAPQIGWLWDGNQFIEPVISKDWEELQNEIIKLTQKHLDDFAASRNYDGMLSLCTYATSGVEKFQLEGQYGVSARDATWTALYQILEDINNENRPKPNSFEEIKSELPALNWPI